MKRRTAALMMCIFTLLSGTSALAGTKSTKFGVSLRIVPAGEAQQQSQDHQQQRVTLPPLRYTCGAASGFVVRAGFANPQVISCNGVIYQFAATLSGQEMTISVDATTGEIRSATGN